MTRIALIAHRENGAEAGSRRGTSTGEAGPLFFRLRFLYYSPRNLCRWWSRGLYESEDQRALAGEEIAHVPNLLGAGMKL